MIHVKAIFFDCLCWHNTIKSYCRKAGTAFLLKFTFIHSRESVGANLLAIRYSFHRRSLYFPFNMLYVSITTRRGDVAVRETLRRLEGDNRAVSKKLDTASLAKSIPRCCLLESHGSWLLALGSWLLALGSWRMAHGAWRGIWPIYIRLRTSRCRNRQQPRFFKPFNSHSFSSAGRASPLLGHRWRIQLDLPHLAPT